MTYASVVSRDSVRIVLKLATLNNLDILCADVQNAYSNAKPKERVYFYAGDEFGIDKSKLVIVVRALYGPKGAGSAWAAAIRQEMRDLGFTPCLADTDVWMRTAVDTSRLETSEHVKCQKLMPLEMRNVKSSSLMKCTLSEAVAL